MKETNKNIKLNNYTIEIKNITFSYPKNMNKIILENFSLVIPENSNLLVKGSIGSGKSTIGRLLSQSYKPQKGNILIGGIGLFRFKRTIYKFYLSCPKIQYYFQINPFSKIFVIHLKRK